MAWYKESEPQVIEVMKGTPIHHVHGMLGNLEAVPYGDFTGDMRGETAKRAAAAIQIIHEAEPRSEPFLKAQLALRRAEKVAFLGFGYHPLNMDRLQLRESLKDKFVVGTAKT